MTRSSSARLAMLAVLLVAAAFRFHGLNWDQQIGAHPDERYLVGVANLLSFPDRLNPFDVAPEYAYGHFPLYLLALAGVLAPEIDPLLLGRALSASFDLLTVALTFTLARRLYGTRAGVLAAALIGLTVGHVQQAHFYTVDPLLSALVAATLLFAVRFVQEGRPLDVWLAGASAGLALGTKAIAGLLVFPLSVACSMPSASSGRPQPAVWRCGLAAGLSFAVVDAFALIELPTFLRNVAGQGAIVRGVFDVPYTRQYHRTAAYVYPIVQQARWGMGWLLVSVALAGLGYALIRTARRESRPESWILWAWVVPFFGFVGGLHAKFPRYMLPVLPVLAICAAHLVVEVTRGHSRRLLILSTILLGTSLLRCLALASIYRAPHPWVEASHWLYEHAAEGATIAVEAWDHPLPLASSDYRLVELPIYAEETAEKWELIDRALERADYVVVASRRGYGSLSRWPARHRESAIYYERLFGGELGFVPAACFGRHPRLGSWALVDDPTAGLGFSLPGICRPKSERVLPLGRLDESFVVYDHPQTIVFRAAH